MTFFIDAPKELPEIKSNNPDIDVSSAWDGLGAAITSSSLRNDANFKAHREVNKSTNDLGRLVAERVGLEAMLDGQEYDAFNRAPESIDQGFQRQGIEWSQRAIKLAREDAELNPDKWSDVDLSEEGIQGSANSRMQAELQDAQETLDMMPSGQFGMELLGEMVGMTADIKNIPFLMMGGGGGSLRAVMGREAAINMAAEAAFLPSQFSQAERLDIPDPDVATQLALASGAGAVLGGTVYAAGRGLTLWKQRNGLVNDTPYDDQELSALVERIEETLDSETSTPFDDAAEIVKNNSPSVKNTINPKRDPLILDDSLRVDQGLDDARANDVNAKKPLVDHLRNTDRIDPDGSVGQELKARGITAQSAPGLFARGGRIDFDNLVASDLDDLFPGIREATRTPSDATYLDRDGLVDVLERDLNGDADWLRSRQDVNAQERILETTTQQDFVSLRQSDDPDTLFINPDNYEFDVSPDQAAENIARDVQGWIDSHPRGYRDILTPEEQTEIVTALQQNGGDAEYLIERIMEREADYIDLPAEKARLNEEDIPFGEAITSTTGSKKAVSKGQGRSEQNTGSAQSSGSDVEVTGLATRETFSDPTSSEARIIQNSIIDDIRTSDIKTEADLSDGKGVRPVSEILDELDQDQEFLDIINLCGRAG